VPEGLAAPYIRSGQLIRVLDQWCPRNDALFLHYSGHRQVPAALRALIDMIRAARHSLVDPLAEEMHARTPAVATSPRHPRPNGVERAAQR
jgi:hypothetical protein